MTDDQKVMDAADGSGRTDLLESLLELAQKEGAFEGAGFEAFGTALRERAERILAERLERAERITAERLERLESQLRVLSKETEWQKEAIDTLSTSVRSLEAENRWRLETIGNLEAELQSTRTELGEATASMSRASNAHATLLAHQRELTERLAAELSGMAALPLWRVDEVRRRLESLVARLRADSR